MRTQSTLRQLVVQWCELFNLLADGERLTRELERGLMTWDEWQALVAAMDGED